MSKFPLGCLLGAWRDGCACVGKEDLGYRSQVEQQAQVLLSILSICRGGEGRQVNEEVSSHSFPSPGRQEPLVFEVSDQQ